MSEEEHSMPTKDEAHGENATSAKPRATPKKKNKKSGGSFGIFKAALFMLKKKKGSKSSKNSAAKQEPVPEAANNWTKLVDSMRPLHLQETNAISPASSVAGGDEYQPPSPPSLVEDVIVRPPYSPSAASTSTGTMSKYASAQSLRDLYNSSDDEDDDDDEDPDAMFDALCGDEMIDAKADEFIARFYKQIHMQNSTATAHHHRGGTI